MITRTPVSGKSIRFFLLRSVATAALSVTLRGQSAGEFTLDSGTLALDAPLTLTGDGFAIPGGDIAYESAGQRNALVVYGGATLTLADGADVMVSNANNLTAFLRVGYGTAGHLVIQDGASLAVGSLDRYANFHIGQGATGTVTQTGGEVTSIGSFNVGVNGGDGTYTISGGSLTFDHAGAGAANRTTLVSVGFNNATSAAGTSSGTFNIEGGLVELKAVQDGGVINFIIGNRAMDALAAYGGGAAGAGNGEVVQTGGVFRVGAGAALFLSGYGNGSYALNGGALEIGGDSLRAQYGNHSGYTYDFSLGGGTIKVIGSDLTSDVDLRVVDRDATGAFTQSFIDTNGFGATLSGDITGDGALVKIGLGALTLSGSNNITGQAYVVGGAINQSGGVSAIKYLAVGSGAGADGDYNLSSGTLNITQGLQVGDWGGAGVFNQTGGTVNVVGSFNVGNQGGSGEYNLSAGALNLSGGLYNIGRNTDTKPASTGVFNLSGTGVLDVAGGNFIIGNRDSTATAGNGTGVFNQTGGVFRISGTTGADNLFLSGYGNGVYNLSGGRLEIGGNRLRANYGGSGTYAFNLGGGTIRVINEALTTSVVPTLVDGTTSTIDTNGLGAVFSNGLNGTGAFTKTGTGTMTLAGTSVIGKVAAGTWTPTVSAVDKGVLAITGNATVLGILAANGDETEFGAPETATISLANGASLTIGNGVSPGSYLLVGYGKTGAFSMTGGTLAVNGVEGAPFPGSGIAVGDMGGSGRFSMSAGTIDLEDGGNIVNLSVGTGGGTGEFAQSGGTVNLGTNFSVGAGVGSSGTYSVSGTAVLNAQPVTGSTIIYIGDDGGSGLLEIGGSAAVNWGAGTSVWIGGIQSAAHSGSTGTVTQTGGTVTFEGNFFQLGGRAGDTGTYNLDGGTLAIGGTDGIRAGAGTANFNLGGGTLKIAGSNFTTSVRARLKTGTVSTIDTNGFNATFSGGLTGAGGFTKTGEGELRVSGNSDYTGTTTISAGVFRVDGVLSATTVNVGSGATLSGHGTIARVNILNGGKVDLGAVPGVLTVTGDLTFGDTSRLLLRAASEESYDRIEIGGLLTSGGTFEFVFAEGYEASIGASFSLLVADDYSGGFTAFILPELGEGLVWNTAAFNSAGILSVEAGVIPEPGSIAFAAGVVALFIVLWRRRGLRNGAGKREGVA